MSALYKEAQREVERLTKQNVSLNQSLKALELLYHDVVEQRTDLEVQVRDSTKVVDDAMLEKERAELSAEQCQQEIERLAERVTEMKERQDTALLAEIERFATV